MGFVESLKSKIVENGIKAKIVYPDGAVETCVEAASILCNEGIITPVVLGDIGQIKDTAAKNGWNLEGAEIIDPKKSLPDDFIDTYFEKRKHKGIDKDFARSQMERVHFYGAMMVEKGLANGMVGGLTSDTKPFIPAFEIIKTKPGIKRASAIFFMVKGDDVKLYSDCAMNMNPDADTLAQIGAASGDTAKSFGFEPNIAFLSFSTFGTAEDPLVDKVSEATRIAKTLRPEYNIDGEMQFDAALLPAVAQKKCPDSPVAGKANVYVFPDLNAGNIGYKITERLGGYDAVGPIFQGLNKPANDLSRGAKPKDIANSGYLTVVQALN
ncbi:MAG: phosphate acetyltransferase [Gammaproteobacteria bacterium]|nr:MAG: phosphate acetyltransferase [Gammaproteobacteria bacterium]